MSAGSVSEHLRAGAPAADQVPARMPGIADPVPVGIAGFAMTTFILSCINGGFFGGIAATPMVLGLAIFYGGLVQLLAGLWAFRRGETFVAVAFCSMTIAALRTNAAVLCVFVTLTATYLLLTLANLGVATSSLLPIGGYVGITCGVAAWYVAFAHVTSASSGRELIPTWRLT